MSKKVYKKWKKRVKVTRFSKILPFALFTIGRVVIGWFQSPSLDGPGHFTKTAEKLWSDSTKPGRVKQSRVWVVFFHQFHSIHWFQLLLFPLNSHWHRGNSYFKLKNFNSTFNKYSIFQKDFNRKYTCQSVINKLNFCFIWKISVSTSLMDKV